MNGPAIAICIGDINTVAEQSEHCNLGVGMFVGAGCDEDRDGGSRGLSSIL